MTFEKLLCHSTKEIEALFLNKRVIVQTKSGEELEFIVRALQMALYESSLVTGFITHDNQRIGIEKIKFIDVKK